MADEEFRKAITSYADSWPFAPPSEKRKEMWIEMTVNDPTFEIHKLFRTFHTQYGRYPTQPEVCFLLGRGDRGVNLFGETAT